MFYFDKCLNCINFCQFSDEFPLFSPSIIDSKEKSKISLRFIICQYKSANSVDLFKYFKLMQMSLVNEQFCIIRTLKHRQKTLLLLWLHKQFVVDKFKLNWSFYVCYFGQINNKAFYVCLRFILFHSFPLIINILCFPMVWFVTWIFFSRSINDCKHRYTTIAF